MVMMFGSRVWTSSRTWLAVARLSSREELTCRQVRSRLSGVT